MLGVELVTGAGIKKDVGYVVCRGVWHDVWGWVGYQGAVRGEAGRGGGISRYQRVVRVTAAPT